MLILKKLISHNWFAVIYFNFRMLPWRQAIKLPFDFYYGVRFECLAGNVVIESSKIRRAMIKIGGRGSEMFARQDSIIDIKGTVKFRGVCELGHGSLLRVEKSGVMIFGDCARVGAMSKIFCCHEITIGDEVDFSWECQIFDTNFHFIRDKNNGLIDLKDKAINIGSYNWFGNRVTVMKGVCTPKYFIVASNSLCTKDFSEYAQYSVVGGIPAVLIAEKKERVFENLEDVSLFKSN